MPSFLRASRMKNSILNGITVLELNGLAPIQFCGKILSDFGARVIRIDKIEDLAPQDEFLGNGKMSVSINLKSPKGVDVFKRLSSKADVIVEPFRAGVMEKLGLGPNVLMQANERLIYARLTGFGQTGLYSKSAGHDINFLSLSGVQALLGWKNKAPDPPCNIIGDFAGGSLMCALGIIMALYERERSGKGQVVDLSILRGTSYLASWIFGTRDVIWSEPRGNNILDGGSFFYTVYETKDGKWMSVGAIEKKFYDNLLKGLNLSEDECSQFDRGGYEILKEKFKTKTQSEWVEIFKNLDACVTPVMTVDEAARERPEDFGSSFEKLPMPRPEPRFSRSESYLSSSRPPPAQGEHTLQILKLVGFTAEEIDRLKEDNIIRCLTLKNKL